MYPHAAAFRRAKMLRKRGIVVAFRPRRYRPEFNR